MNHWEGLDKFVAAAETGQFIAATEHMSVSSSRISRQVTRPEERLRTRLPYHSIQRVSLSEVRQTFLQHCQHLQDARDEALCAANDLSAEPKGLLRITYAVAYGKRFIVPLVNTFVADYPQLRVDIELSNRQLDLLHEGFDLAIHLGRLSDSQLITTRLTPRIMYLCAIPEYLRRHGTPQSPVELGQFNCLVGSNDLWSFLKDGRGTQYRIQGNWRCNSGQAVLGATLHDFGLYQLPDYYVIEHLRSGRLVPLLEGHQPPNTAVRALYPQQQHLSPKARQLASYLKEGLTQSHPGFTGGKNLR